jgi:hypothetical protein
MGTDTTIFRDVTRDAQWQRSRFTYPLAVVEP